MNGYEDIIGHPYSGVKTHSPMSMEARATQFAPFAALHGHDESIGEAANASMSEEEPEKEGTTRTAPFL